MCYEHPYHLKRLINGYIKPFVSFLFLQKCVFGRYLVVIASKIEYIKLLKLLKNNNSGFLFRTDCRCFFMPYSV